MKKLLVYLEMIRNQRVQDNGVCGRWQLENFVLSCIVLLRSDLTILCLSHDFGTILKIFAKSKYYFDVIREQHFNLQEMKNWVIFPIIIDKYSVPQLLWCQKSHSNWRLFMYFPYQNLIWSLSIRLKVRASATYILSQANWVVFNLFFW